jgi:hypothetical protein
VESGKAAIYQGLGAFVAERTVVRERVRRMPWSGDQALS